jgi:nanoRNase/pAp phosphatase (c-di-AMP/oligoRNAs hydrolase)
MDVSEIAKQYGGGGHKNASGFRVSFDHELASAK